MADAHPNVQRVLQSMHAFNANDIEGVKAVFRPDVVYRVAGRSRFAGEYYGIEEYAAVVERVRQASGGSMHVALEVVLADDITVMMLARTQGVREGRTLDSESVYLFRFDAQGMCYEGRTIPVDQYAYDAFWA